MVSKLFRNVRADWDWERFGWGAGERPPDGVHVGACHAHDDCRDNHGYGCAGTRKQVKVKGCSWCDDDKTCQPCISWDPKDLTASVDGKAPIRCQQVARNHDVHEQREREKGEQKAAARHGNASKHTQ